MRYSCHYISGFHFISFWYKSHVCIALHLIILQVSAHYLLDSSLSTCSHGHYHHKFDFASGWDETRFLGRDRDRVIRGVKFLYETETEKFYLEDYSTRPRQRNSIYKFFVRDETETRLDWFFLNETKPRRDQIENCPRDQDGTETRPRRDWDETKTKKAKLWWSFYINKKWHVLILANGSCRTKLSF